MSTIRIPANFLSVNPSPKKRVTDIASSRVFQYPKSTEENVSVSSLGNVIKESGPS
ncbi:hypothetical protein K3495_g6576 [Podosphaera aphanis]|nr:hypothetical protein K3495_g6576 [Podosphaera aphanis]